LLNIISQDILQQEYFTGIGLAKEIAKNLCMKDCPVWEVKEALGFPIDPGRGFKCPTRLY
jgi:hypothetical protein